MSATKPSGRVQGREAGHSPSQSVRAVARVGGGIAARAVYSGGGGLVNWVLSRKNYSALVVCISAGSTATVARLSETLGSMGHSTDERGICPERNSGLPPPVTISTSRGRCRNGQASNARREGVSLPSAAFSSAGGRGRSRRGFSTFLSAGARRGVGGWAAGALMFAVGLVLLAARPAEALTKPYSRRDTVAVIANNVSRWCRFSLS